ncbi:serine/threonine-protein phosphatase regulatory subunit, partial [Acrasis kona]
YVRETQKLIRVYLRKTENLTKLIEFLTIKVEYEASVHNVTNGFGDSEQDDDDEVDTPTTVINQERLQKRSVRYPDIAAKILTSDVDELYDGIVRDRLLMDTLLSFLQHPRDTLSESWIRVMNILCARRGAEVQKYIVEEGDEQLVSLFIQHINLPDMDEIILKLMGCGDAFVDDTCSLDPSAATLHQIKMKIWLQTGGGKSGNVDLAHYMGSDQTSQQPLTDVERVSEWWLRMGFVDKLIHSLSDPSAQDRSVNLTRLVCEIIKRSQASHTSNPIANQLLNKTTCDRLVDMSLTNESVVRYSLPLLITFLDFGSDAMMQEEESESDQVVPDAIKVILDHLHQIVTILKNGSDARCIETTFGTLRPPLGDSRLRLVDFLITLFQLCERSVSIQTMLMESKVLEILCDLFFAYEFNNMLHNAFCRIVAIIMSARADKNQCLKKCLIRQCNLLTRIVTANERNDFEQSKPKGMRRGYMGHLTHISNLIMFASDNDSQVNEWIRSHSEWNEYVGSALRDRNLDESRQIGAPLTDTSSEMSDKHLAATKVHQLLPLLDPKQQEEIDREFEAFDDEMEYSSSSSDEEEEDDKGLPKLNTDV